MPREENFTEKQRARFGKKCFIFSKDCVFFQINVICDQSTPNLFSVASYQTLTYHPNTCTLPGHIHFRCTLHRPHKCHPFHTCVQRILGLRRAKQEQLPLFCSKMQITAKKTFTLTSMLWSNAEIKSKLPLSLCGKTPFAKHCRPSRFKRHHCCNEQGIFQSAKVHLSRSGVSNMFVLQLCLITLMFEIEIAIDFTSLTCCLTNHTKWVRGNCLSISSNALSRFDFCVT